MPGTCCSVPGCSLNGGHEFPSDQKRMKAWVVAIRRVEDKKGRPWYPSATSVVCKAHFLPSDYVTTNYTGTIAKKMRLKRDAVPSQFPWTAKASQSSTARSACLASQKAREPPYNPPHCSASVSIVTAEDTGDLQYSQEVLEAAEVKVSASLVNETYLIADVGTQANIDVGSQQLEVAVQTCDTVVGSPLSEFVNNPRVVHYFTGLENYDIFSAVLTSLGPAAYELTYLNNVKPHINVPDQLLLTLMKLRTYKPNFELGLMFKVGESEVYSIVVTWIRFMSLQWREVNIWPTHDAVHFFAPFDFKSKFPQTSVIIDGVENPVKKPSSAAAQQITFSHYKNRNTGKTVVGVTPGGLTSLVSQSYGGSTSDRQIVERSRLRQLLAPGDHVMADKGFDIQDMMAPLGVTVNIPTFFRKKNRMENRSVLRDRKIASKRVHVERVIGSAKTYKILTQPLTQTESLLTSDIVFVCFMLVNFRRSIVPRNA